MKTARKNRRRTVVALSLSTTFHAVILAFILTQAAPEYQLPESIAPPMDVQIMPMPEPPPPPVLIERLPPLKPQPAKPEPKPPQPPKPKPVEPAPTPPAPLPPAPAKPAPPAPVAPKPALPQPTVVKPLPAPPAPVAPPLARAPTPPAPPAPPTPAAPVHLNIHKPEKEAPASIATLPFAPAAAPSAPPPTGAPAAAAGGEPSLGGSRLSGLTPYPYGAMPSGGSGLRGTLVGCANADAVHLSEAERERCAERLGARATSAPALDPISPTKRAAFDKAEEKQNRDLEYRDSGLPPGTSRGAHSFGGMSNDEPAVIPLPR